MDRREFFRRSAGKLAETAVKEAEARANQKAMHWIRPPYAINELDFLLACTRCAACIEACPEQVIFPLASRLGPEVVGTPALDLLNKACKLCEGWPCVQSCEPKALQLPVVPEGENLPLPKLARLAINTESCLPYLGPECGACAGACPVPGALQWEMEKPSINEEACTGCALCRLACIVEPKAIAVSVLAEPES